MKVKLIYVILSFVVVISLIQMILQERMEKNERNEKTWYVNNLGYEFCGIVTKSDILYQKYGYGQLQILISSKPKILVEDSLNTLLVFNRSLRFIKKKEEDTYQIICLNGAEIEKGDSICVSTKFDLITFYRNGNFLTKRDVSYNLFDKYFK